MVEKVHKFSSHCPSVCFGTRKEEKSMRVEEKNFHTYKIRFSFFFYLDPSTFKAHKFLISSSF
jgi:hypothetical protein